MNKIYRLKFSKRLNQLVAVSEITTGHDRNSGSNQVTETGATGSVAKKLLSLRPLSALIASLSFLLWIYCTKCNGKRTCWNGSGEWFCFDDSKR